MTVLAQTHIVATPDTCFGKPRIAGHRIRVQDVAVWHAREHRSEQEIADTYGLTMGQVHAALAYYFDHQSEIDSDIADSERAFAEMDTTLSSKVRGRLGA
jgi:uncharacterized protein (DUF433 family)